ncbi:MAG: PD-(D/E)XK nuclease family protein [Holophagaceae bacterium]
MSHDPFDGVLLNDPRPPVPGAVGMLLHLRVARRLAKARGWARPGLEAVRARSEACRELMAHGLLPEALRGLQAHGLELGSPASPHGLAAVVAHLEAYLREVEAGGWIEPDAALWRAVDAELAGRRGLWVERGPEDGPLAAKLQDLAPVRLRALACVPGLEATFTLATRKGGGLFGSPQPLAAWFLDGIEAHGEAFPNALGLEEPPGWGAAPWTPALDDLFEGPLRLGDHRDTFQRGLVEGPVDLLGQALEQVCAWLDAGLATGDITLVHPDPVAAAAFLGPLLAEEGVALHLRGGLRPLKTSAAWSPLWTLLQGLQRLDPCACSAGLRASRSKDLRAWAEALGQADQDGAAAFAASLQPLSGPSRAAAEAMLAELLALREATLPAQTWAARLEALAGTLRLPVESEDFYAPLGLLKEAWNLEAWTFADLLVALEAFLDTARAAGPARVPGGLRLLAPGSLVDDWEGSRATLILDLREGAWPPRPGDNPDLDGDRQAAINRALAAQTAAEAATEPGTPFPAALQRFLLPRAEHGDQVPRAFQRDAYAFNKALAMTSERLLALSPSQDEEGRLQAQGPFWTALEGAAAFVPRTDRVASGLRWRWEGRDPDARAEARAEAAQARTPEAALLAEAPAEDRCPGLREAWMKGQDAVSPTALEGLAQCPFRSLAERVWRLQTFDAGSRLRMARGTLVHHVMEAALQPFLGLEDWPGAFLAAHGLGPETGPEDLLPALLALWEAHRETWLAELSDLPLEQRPQAALALEDLLPNLADALLRDARAQAPTKWELALVAPDLLPFEAAQKPGAAKVLTEGWTRSLVGLEGALGPMDLDLGNGRVLPLTGKVDRLERWAHEGGRTFLRVVDYKTSKAGALRAYAEDGAPFGAHLQTPLYLLLAEQGRGDLPVTAALVPLRDEQPEPFTDHLRTLLAAGDWRARLRSNLARFDARLDAGDFPPTPGEACAHCQLAALCGRPVDVTVDAEGED